jgi:hypothetical protein
MTNGELDQLAALPWMPSRIPVLDALTTLIPKGAEVAAEHIPPTYEQRWYPQEDGSLRLRIPYNGGPFDNSFFQIMPGGWDHTTCDLCTVHIPAMTLCYVTRSGRYVGLCAQCYSRSIVTRVGLIRGLVWKAKRMLGIYAAA